MVKLTTDTLKYAPISCSQSQARKARHTIPACNCKARHAIPACKVQTSYPSMHSKSHCIKGAARTQNSGQAVGVRRTQYRGLAEPTLQHFRKLDKA